MELSKLKRIETNKKRKKRVGRGMGSGKGGHTVGSGMKGQKSRSGNSMPFGFEGGQVPLYKKLPKMGGFRNPATKSIATFSLKVLNIFKEGDTVTPAKLIEQGIIKKLPKHGIKLLNKGSLEKKVNVKGFRLSTGAIEAIEKAGGKIVSD